MLQYSRKFAEQCHCSSLQQTQCWEYYYSLKSICDMEDPHRDSRKRRRQHCAGMLNMVEMLSAPTL